MYEEFYRQFERVRKTLALIDDPLKKLKEQRNLFETALNPSGKYFLSQETIDVASRASEQLRNLILPENAITGANVNNEIQANFQNVIKHLSLAYGNPNISEISLDDRFAMSAETVRALGELGKTLRTNIEEMQDEFKQVSSNIVPLFNSLQSYFDSTVIDVEKYQVFNRTFASEYLEYLGRIKAADEEEDRSRIIDDFFGFLVSIRDKLPQTILSYGLIRELVIIFLFFMVVEYPSDKAMEKRIKEDSRIAVEESEERIREHFDFKFNEFMEETNAKIEDLEDKISLQIMVVTEHAEVRSWSD